MNEFFEFFIEFGTVNCYRDKRYLWMFYNNQLMKILIKINNKFSIIIMQFLKEKLRDTVLYCKKF